MPSSANLSTDMGNAMFASASYSDGVAQSSLLIDARRLSGAIMEFRSTPLRSVGNRNWKSTIALHQSVHESCSLLYNAFCAEVVHPRSAL